jgi:hypothetical protein
LTAPTVGHDSGQSHLRAAWFDVVLNLSKEAQYSPKGNYCSFLEHVWIEVDVSNVIELLECEKTAQQGLLVKLGKHFIFSICDRSVVIVLVAVRSFVEVRNAGQNCAITVPFTRSAFLSQPYLLGIFRIAG